jgi:hypothetical protein
MGRGVQSGVRVLNVNTVVLSAAEQHARSRSPRYASPPPDKEVLSIRTLLWSYLAQRQILREMSRFEIGHSFTDADRQELRVRFPRKGCLGAALQLGFSL